MFTRLSVALRAAGDVLSLEQLMEVISSCFTTKEGKTPKCALVGYYPVDLLKGRKRPLNPFKRT